MLDKHFKRKVPKKIGKYYGILLIGKVGECFSPQTGATISYLSKHIREKKWERKPLKKRLIIPHFYDVTMLIFSVIGLFITQLWGL